MIRLVPAVLAVLALVLPFAAAAQAPPPGVVIEDVTGAPRPSTDFVPLLALALADRATVDAELGAPSACQPTRRGPRCTYRDGAVEVVYIAGRADGWTVFLPRGTPFIPSAVLSILGLPVSTRPNWSNEHVMRWSGIEGLREVGAFPGGPRGTAWYVYVRARTP
jgi:hypothetical protein